MTTRIFIIAHAPLAHALRECALHVFADSADSVLALDVLPQAAPDDTLVQARQLLADAPDVPTLVLTDLFGATPCNVAQRLIEGRPASLVAGLNLPMLLRAVCYRAEPLDALVQRAVDGGSQGVMQVLVSAVSAQTLHCPCP
ncbi:PTS sugar transporter subunit IIA [Simplicispira psychrophila]|uniref:PTS sugar transporter subunit IIA n=1 Tax=Simplicispira psychrophila TaxID=80882 RepID=UPI000689D9DE|nr:PTS sugar transporter subunit IIA [Simplicispira psychrophila]